MAEEFLESAVQDVPSLRAVFITAVPDCLLYASWVREGETLVPEDVASYFGDLVRANRQGLKALGSWSSEMQVTIESADTLIVIREVREDFVCGCAFERSAPLGMVRLHLKRMLDRVVAHLPSIEPQERPRAVRVLEFLERYAPDPHAVLLRVSLRSQISTAELDDAAALNDEQTARLEAAAKAILGLETLNI